MNEHLAASMAVCPARALQGFDGSVISLRDIAAFGPCGVSDRPKAGARADDIGAVATP